MSDSKALLAKEGTMPEVHLHVDGELSIDDAEVLRDVIAAATQRRMTGHVLTEEQCGADREREAELYRVDNCWCPSCQMRRGEMETPW